MCTYKCEKTGSLKGTPCLYPTLLADLGIAALPVDSSGACIFHSTDLDWKIANGFKEKFDGLFRLLDDTVRPTQNDGFIFNFTGFQFCNGGQRIVFTGLRLQNGLDFSHAVFHDEVRFVDSDLHSIDFQQACFEKKLVLQETSCSNTFYGNQARFKYGCSFVGCQFGGYVMLEKARFESDTSHAGPAIEIKKCHFKALLSVLQVTSDIRVDITKSVFSGAAKFNNCTFRKEFVFRGNTISNTLEFRNTHFTQPSTDNEHYSEVDFAFCTVDATGKLLFVGPEPFSDMIAGKLDVDVTVEDGGMIIFDNFNINCIRPEDKDKLMELEKITKARIGPGCRKYYCQTKLFMQDGKDALQRMTLDLARIFCNYFEVQYAANLGIEIVERTPSQIRYFYFTDQNLTIDAFNELMARCEVDLWTTFSRITSAILPTLTAKDLDVYEVMTRLSALLMIIGKRIAVRDASENDLLSILSGASFQAQPLVDVGLLYHELASRFSEKRFPAPQVTVIHYHNEVGTVQIHQTQAHSNQFDMSTINNNFHAPVNAVHAGEGDQFVSSLTQVQEAHLNNALDAYPLTAEARAAFLAEYHQVRTELVPEKKTSRLADLVARFLPTATAVTLEILKATL